MFRMVLSAVCEAGSTGSVARLTSFGFGDTQCEETIKTRATAHLKLGCITFGKRNFCCFCDEHHAHSGTRIPTIVHMHELSIASSVLEAVTKEAERRPNSRIVKVGLRIGELAGVDCDALSFGW